MNARFLTPLPSSSHPARAYLDSLLEPVERDLPADETNDDLAIVATVFSQLKTDPGPVGVASVLTELEKLEHLRRLDLPADLFADVPPKILQGTASEPPPNPTRDAFAPCTHSLYLDGGFLPAAPPGSAR